MHADVFSIVIILMIEVRTILITGSLFLFKATNLPSEIIHAQYSIFTSYIISVIWSIICEFKDAKSKFTTIIFAF